MSPWESYKSFELAVCFGIDVNAFLFFLFSNFYVNKFWFLQIAAIKK